MGNSLSLSRAPSAPVLFTTSLHPERAWADSTRRLPSRSGFVEEHHRSTPQAFSHYTFQASGGQLMVVDIQGVGDLYTDPQFHTLSGAEFGEGNLGPRGMALFFRGHECDSLCETLRLCPFPQSALDVERIKNGLFKRPERDPGDAGDTEAEVRGRQA